MIGDLSLGIAILTQDELAFKPKLEKDQVPFFCAGTDESVLYPISEWQYFTNPTWADEFGGYCKWIMENWKKSTPPVMAVMGPDIPFGKAYMPLGKAYAESLGMKVLPQEMIPYVPVDVSTQLLRVKEAAPDFVYITGLETTSAPVLKNAQALGIRKQLNFCGYQWAMGPDLIKMVGAEVAEGFSAAYAFPDVSESQNPGIQEMIKLQMKYQNVTSDKVQLNQPYFNGWVIANVACEAISRAAKEVGPAKVNGVAVKNALDTIKNFNVRGFTTITYSKEDRRGNDRIQMCQIQGGTVKSVSDWRKAPWLKPTQ
jgi:branched-chain amino acid transport system substrate-binding protein